MSRSAGAAQDGPSRLTDQPEPSSSFGTSTQLLLDQISQNEPSFFAKPWTITSKMNRARREEHTSVAWFTERYSVLRRGLAEDEFDEVQKQIEVLQRLGRWTEDLVKSSSIFRIAKCHAAACAYEKSAYETRRYVFTKSESSALNLAKDAFFDISSRYERPDDDSINSAANRDHVHELFDYIAKDPDRRSACKTMFTQVERAFISDLLLATRGKSGRFGGQLPHRLAKFLGYASSSTVNLSQPGESDTPERPVSRNTSRTDDSAAVLVTSVA